MPCAYPAHPGYEVECLPHRAHHGPLAPPFVPELELRWAQLALTGNPGTVLHFDKQVDAPIPDQQIGHATPHRSKIDDRAANGTQRGDNLPVVRVPIGDRPAAGHYQAPSASPRAAIQTAAATSPPSHAASRSDQDGRAGSWASGTRLVKLSPSIGQFLVLSVTSSNVLRSSRILQATAPKPRAGRSR